MAYTKTNWIDRALQYAKRYYMNSDGGNDKNLLPPFTDWTKHANAVINSDYSLTLTATAGFQTTVVNVPLNPSTTYTMSIDSNSDRIVIDVLDVSGAIIISPGISTSGSGIRTFTFTTASNARSGNVRLYQSTTGTFTFTNPQLEQSASATAFTPKKMYTITQSGGTVTANGTPLNAANFNKLEQGVFDAHTTADAAITKIGGTTGAINNATGYQWGGVAMAQTRIHSSGSYIEWNNGGTWRPVGGVTSARKVSGTLATYGVTYNIINVTGAGSLKMFSAANLNGTDLTVTVTIDGVLYNTFSNGLMSNCTMNNYGNMVSAYPNYADITFKQSLLVTMYGSNVSYTTGWSYTAQYDLS